MPTDLSRVARRGRPTNQIKSTHCKQDRTFPTTMIYSNSLPHHRTWQKQVRSGAGWGAWRGIALPPRKSMLSYCRSGVLTGRGTSSACLEVIWGNGRINDRGYIRVGGKLKAPTKNKCAHKTDATESSNPPLLFLLLWVHFGPSKDAVAHQGTECGSRRTRHRLYTANVLQQKPSLIVLSSRPPRLSPRDGHAQTRNGPPTKKSRSVNIAADETW